MSRPDDYGIVADLLREFVDGGTPSVKPSTRSHRERIGEALAALERLASTEHNHAHQDRALCEYRECASYSRDCLAKVRG